MLVALVVVLALALAASIALATRLWLERREVRLLVDAERGLPTTVALRRLRAGGRPAHGLPGALFPRGALLEAARAPVLVIDEELRVVRSNGAARRAFGRAAGSALSVLSPALARAVRGVMVGPPIAEVE